MSIFYHYQLLNTAPFATLPVMRHLITLCTLITFMPLQAGFLDTSTMRIANKTDAPAYVAIYHQSASSLLRATQPLLLPADNAVRTALPSARLLHSRVLCIASSPALLPEQTSTTSHHFLTAPLRIGLWQADDVTLYTHHYTSLRNQ